MKTEKTFSFDSEINKEVLDLLMPKDLNNFSLGVDYGSGDIQNIGTFKLLPQKILKFKRKKKGKRFIIFDYKLDETFCLQKLGDEE